MKKIFVPVVGQFMNIGDVLHRRELLSWLDQAGALHIYVGKAPKSFIDALHLSKNVTIYKNLAFWVFQILISGYKKTFFVFNPGEIRLEKKRFIREFILIPLLGIVKLKKGKVLRVGIAAMSDSNNKYIYVWKKIFKITDKIFWRTYDSHNKFEIGDVIPDLAFYDIDKEAIKNTKRKYLAISMRGAHSKPSDKWYFLVKEIAKINNLQIIVVPQVRIDNDRCKEIGDKLNAECFLWSHSDSHNDQEAIVKNIYSNSLLIISDRLHALILAYSRGAIPVNLLTTNKEKVQHHFDVIGFKNVNYLIDDSLRKEKVLEDIQYKVACREEYIDVLLNANAQLEEVKIEIQLLLK